MPENHEQIETTPRDASQGRGWASWPVLIVLMASMILAVLAGAGFFFSA
jgi:hypothetical protein